MPPFDPLVLARGSNLVTRPKLGDFISSREELIQRCTDVFQWVADGRINVRIDSIFTVDEAKKAHDRIEAGKTKGKILLEFQS